MDALDKGTGGVHDLGPPGFQPGIDLPAHAVGADDDGIAGVCLLRRIDDPDPRLMEGLHHMAVVNDRPQGHGALPRCGGGLDQLHRPADAEAEPGAFGNTYTHREIFSSTIFRMAATDCSRSISEVSTFTESRHIFRGAMSRWVSW